MTSTSETTAINTSLDDLLNEHFAGRVVRKDLTKLVKEGANVPVYMLEYLLGNYCASNDPAVIEDGLTTVKRVLAENYVRPDEAEKVKSSLFAVYAMDSIQVMGTQQINKILIMEPAD